MSQRVCSTMDTSCQIFPDVVGDGEKKNDIIVCGSVSKAKQHVIFFGGDVQDYPERMDRNNPAYQEWNLIDTAKLIASQFAESAVFVIKPSVMFLNTFSTYQNFLSFDEEHKKPEFSPDSGALVHLLKLYDHVTILSNERELSCDVRSATSQPQLPTASGDGNLRILHQNKGTIPVKLVGFSKGCVVLNQLIYEYNTYKGNTDIMQFLRHIQEIYFLDGGHIGGSNAFITDDETLKGLAELKYRVFVHVTPYQVNDPMRKWIGEEEKIFVDKLQCLGVDVTEKQHFMDEPGSIENHFKVLTMVGGCGH